MKMVNELRPLVQGKIDKIHQPLKTELVLVVHTRDGNKKLYASSGSADPRLHLIEDIPESPLTPFPFCMLLRKHLVGARIEDIVQIDGDRIIEIHFRAVTELGFEVSKKLVFEIMGKHSNIILVDTSKNTVIDSIKHVSFDTSRARQILPGNTYSYPPGQDKIPFNQITREDMDGIRIEPAAILKAIGGISPQVAESISLADDPYGYLCKIREIETGENESEGAHIYLDEQDSPIDFHTAPLLQYEGSLKRLDFDSLSKAIDYYFENKSSTNRIKQKSHDLTRNLSSLLDKYNLKIQRLKEDLASAEDSEKFRLYGDLLTANLHSLRPGMDNVTLNSYYDNSSVSIPLDPKLSPAKNAQSYYKKYGKSKTAIKEKKIQIEETEKDVLYLESVLTFLENTEKSEEIDLIRAELEETGYIRKRKTKGKSRKTKSAPYKYVSPGGYDVLVGRNNSENDELTLKIADKQDIWLHTKDIHGSHVILRTGGKEPSEEDIYFAASIAAWYSKARSSGQVPVDYVKVRHVKKPSGAKPGMVIFTDNRTVYVTPKLPD